MSFGGKAQIPTTPPKPAGLDSGDLATNEQAVPVPWHIGPRPCPLTWVVDKVYNQRTVEIRSKAGKGKSTVSGYEYYGDVAGIAGLGLATKVTGIEVDNQMIWTGSVARPDNPVHPDYWRTHIVTTAGDFYVYWGRADQPVDDVLLASLGASDPDLAHPGYRHQVLVVAKNFRLQDSGTVPSTRLFFNRAPLPELGTFAPQNSVQGESMVAGILELLTNPIFGAGLPVARFTAAEWEALSAAVIARAGCHAPYLERAQPVRDVVKDLQLYYDGWCRIENGLIRPGFYPHDGSVPGGLTELTVHDFTERPKTNAGAPSETVNDVVVFYRDGADLFKRKPAFDSDSANVEARRAHASRVLEMLGIITFAQAQAFVAEASATGAEGEWSGEIRVRSPRAVWAGGAPLRAGDNFILDLIEPQVDQVSRIERRTDYYDRPPRLQVRAEPGVYPASYVPPGDLRPDIGAVLPLEIASARVLELTPDLAGAPLGLPVAFLAKRPKSEFEGATLQGANMLGFNVWYGGASGASYEVLGSMPGWGVRGVVREAIASATADLTVKLTLDADNLDLGRLAAQSAAGQLNDNLMVVIGEEVFSVGAIALAGLNYDFTCKRVRLGTLPAAHGLGVEAWVVWRDELRVFIHSDWIENTNRYFKLQPYTQTAVLELVDADPILYHFRDRAPELPVIVLNALPGGPVVGVGYNISGQISDVNGDLVSYQVQAARLVGTGGAVDSEITLQAGDVKPTEWALKTFKAPLVFPSSGYWVIIVRAYDETGGFKQLQSAEMNVGVGSGFYGPDDGLTPNPVTGVTLTGALTMIVTGWVNPTNTPVLRVRIYMNTVAVKPATPAAVVSEPQLFYFFDGLGNSDTRYFWFEVEAKNGRLSTVAGPYNTTTRAGINLADIIPGMTLVEIVGALPSTGLFSGRTVYLTTDGKLYRYTGAAWSTAVPAVDVTGQLTNAQIADLAATKVTGQLTNAQIADLATAKLTGQITQTQITDNSISTSKIAAAAITTAKIAADAVTANEIAANAITAAKIAAGQVTTAKLAAGAVTANEIAANAITAAKIAAGEVTTAKLAVGAVTANELAANSVTAGKIAAAAITAAAVGANEIIANTANLANAVVTGAKIADATIGTAKIGDGQITTAKIGDAQINTAKIGDLQVSTLKIGDHAVTFPVSARATGPISVGVNDTVTLVTCGGVEVAGSEDVAIMIGCQFTPVDNDTFYFRIIRSGYGIVEEWGIKAPIIGLNTFAMPYSDAPGTGTYDYSFQIYGISGNTGACAFAKVSMFCIATKK